MAKGHTASSGTPASILSVRLALIPSVLLNKHFMFRVHHIYCFANLGKTLHSMKCLKNPHSKVSANTAERNRVEKGSIGVWGGALLTPLSPERHLSGGGGGEWLGQWSALCGKKKKRH